MSERFHPVPLARTASELGSGDRELASFLAERLDHVDAHEADLRALVHECDRRGRLRAAAAALRDRYPSPADRPPLYGVPVGVKDIIHADGFETRAGTALPPELFAGDEASCVTRLREAGAVLLGKTVTTEFAGAAPGLTRNPHDLDRTPGGSSSGSAAAVAAGYCPLALGTQTGGSVIRPAAYCGVVGMKPSFGRIPRDGVIERSASADHVGLFTQDLEGARLAAAVLCDDWSPVDRPSDRLPRLGVPEGDYLDRASSEAREAFGRQLETLEAAGCEVERVPVPTFEAYDDLDDRHHDLCNAELAAVHDAWFDDYASFYRTPMVDRIERGREVSDERLEACRASRLELREELDGLHRSHDLDAWASPAAPGPALPTITSTGDSVMNRPWTHAGLPTVSVPAGTSPEGLPFGLQLSGLHGEDERLLADVAPLPALL